MSSSNNTVEHIDSQSKGIYVQTGGLIFSRLEHPYPCFEFANRRDAGRVVIELDELAELMDFFERNRTTIRTDNDYVPDLSAWGKAFRYTNGSLSQRCTCCWNEWDRLIHEHQDCPKCGAACSEINAELTWDTVCVETRKPGSKGFYLRNNQADSPEVRIYEPDLDDLIPALDAILGHSSLQPSLTRTQDDSSKSKANQSQISQVDDDLADDKLFEQVIIDGVSKTASRYWDKVEPFAPLYWWILGIGVLASIFLYKGTDNHLLALSLLVTVLLPFILMLALALASAIILPYIISLEYLHGQKLKAGVCRFFSICVEGVAFGLFYLLNFYIDK